MKILNALLAICLMAGAAAAQELTWTELANRPELWPAQCTVKSAIKFEGGASVQPGQKVEVRDFKGERGRSPNDRWKNLVCRRTGRNRCTGRGARGLCETHAETAGANLPVDRSTQRVVALPRNHHPGVRPGPGKDCAGGGSGAREGRPARQGGRRVGKTQRPVWGRHAGHRPDGAGPEVRGR